MSYDCDYRKPRLELSSRARYHACRLFVFQYALLLFRYSIFNLNFSDDDCCINEKLQQFPENEGKLKDNDVPSLYRAKYPTAKTSNRKTESIQKYTNHVSILW